MNFCDYDLDPRIIKGLEEAGYKEAFSIQEKVLKKAMEKKDLCVHSQTGTGKTCAFLISFFQNFCISKTKKKCLVLSPTRELAVQIEQEAKKLGKYLNIQTLAIYGGVGYEKQIKNINKGADLIIATPGRIIDLYKQKIFSFKEFDFVVIDEADRMFDMGFRNEVIGILKALKPKSERQGILLSATMNYEVVNISNKFFNNTEIISDDTKQITVEKIEQKLFHLNEKEKLSLLLGLIKKDKPKSVLIFTNMKHTAVQLAKRLRYNNLKALALTGDLSQYKRLNTTKAFKGGEVAILVATDVAARGLHINDLELVVNYDLPSDCENYVHRIGRTARAGKSGVAVSFACDKYIYNLEAIETYIKMKIPVTSLNENLLEKDLSVGLNYSQLERKTKQERKGSKLNVKKTPRKKGGSANKKKIPKTITEKKQKKGKVVADKKAPLSSKKKRRNRNKSSNDLEKRLSYYKKKYGENFSVNKEASKQEPRIENKKEEKDKGLLKKLKSFLHF